MEVCLSLHEAYMIQEITRRWMDDIVRVTRTLVQQNVMCREEKGCLLCGNMHSQVVVFFHPLERPIFWKQPWRPNQSLEIAYDVFFFLLELGFGRVGP